MSYHNTQNPMPLQVEPAIARPARPARPAPAPAPAGVASGPPRAHPATHEERALLMLPAIYVAWANGRIEKGERAALRAYADGQPMITEPAWQLAEQWLEQRPSDGSFRRGIDRLIELAYDRGHPFTLAMVSTAVDYAVVIEQTDDGGLDPFRIATAAEREATGVVREVVARAHQHHGPEDGVVGWAPTTRWQQVLDELDDTEDDR